MLSKKNVVIENNLEPTDNLDNNQIGAHLTSEYTSEMKVTESFTESMSPTSPYIQKKEREKKQIGFADDTQIEETKGELA